jgi:Putative Ig domain
MRFTRILLFASLLALVVTPVALAIRFTDASYNVPVGETGKQYHHKFDGAAGCGPALPYQFRVLSGSLPPGLTLDKDGTVHGIPTATGDYLVYVELSDENPPSQSWCIPSSAQRDFTFRIIQGLLINEKASNALGVATLNTPFSKQLTTTGAGSSPLTWTVASGSLPTGLALNNGTGVVSGTPTATGDWTFQIKVTDGTRVDSQTYSLSVVQPLAVTAPPQRGAEVGVPVSIQPSATGGRPPYTWSAANLAAGLAIDPSTGAITGTPTAPGNGPAKVTITDSIGLTQTFDVNLPVAPRLAVVKAPLPTGKAGRAYRARVTSTGGVFPRVWTILGGRPGTLPPGIKFNSRTGQFTGTPRKAGTWRLRLQVTDGLRVKSAMPVILKVKA